MKLKEQRIKISIKPKAGKCLERMCRGDFQFEPPLGPPPEDIEYYYLVFSDGRALWDPYFKSLIMRAQGLGFPPGEGILAHSSQYKVNTVYSLTA